MAYLEMYQKIFVFVQKYESKTCAKKDYVIFERFLRVQLSYFFCQQEGTVKISSHSVRVGKGEI